MPKVKLTARGLPHLKPPPKGQLEYFDTTLPGFAVRVTERGIRSFVLFYRIDGKLRRHTIGRCEQLSLAEAREQAASTMHKAAKGIDPRAEKEGTKAAADRARRETFETVVEEYIEKYAKGKKANRTWPETRRILRTNAKDWLQRPVSEITRSDVHDVLDGIMAEGKGYSANRAYAALRTFFAWCLSRDKIPHNPMEGVFRPFDGEKERERVWSDEEVGAIWQAAEEIGGPRGAFLKALVLTGQRLEEVAGMRWDELEEDGTIWRLTVHRAKAKREHVFPLPKLAQRVIQSSPRIDSCAFVFPGRFHDRPMNGWTALKTIVRKHSGVEDFTYHQARHTFRTGLDRLGILPHVKDECLNHSRRGKGAGDRHYSHHDYVPEQRQAFETWADHVSSILAPEGVELLR